MSSQARWSKRFPNRCHENCESIIKICPVIMMVIRMVMMVIMVKVKVMTRTKPALAEASWCCLPPTVQGRPSRGRGWRHSAMISSSPTSTSSPLSSAWFSTSSSSSSRTWTSQEPCVEMARLRIEGNNQTVGSTAWCEDGWEWWKSL